MPATAPRPAALTRRCWATAAAIAAVASACVSFSKSDSSRSLRDSGDMESTRDFMLSRVAGESGALAVRNPKLKLGCDDRAVDDGAGSVGGAAAGRGTWTVGGFGATLLRLLLLLARLLPLSVRPLDLDAGLARVIALILSLDVSRSADALSISN